MSEEKPTDYFALFIIASDPEYKTKWDLTREEQDFIDLVLELRKDMPD